MVTVGALGWRCTPFVPSEAGSRQRLDGFSYFFHPLGHAIYFCFNIRSNSEQKFDSFSSLPSVKRYILALISGRWWNYQQKFNSFCVPSLEHAIYFGFNLRSNSEQNSKASSSLRSARRFKFANWINKPSFDLFVVCCLAV